MTTVRRALACGACLIAAAASAAAAESCSDSLSFTAEGSIGSWTVCDGRLEQCFAEPGDERLQVVFLVDGEPVDLNWQQSSSKELASFLVLDSGRGLEMRRSYEQLDRQTLVHTVSVRNGSAEPVSVGLDLYSGARLRRESDTRGSLADLVYGFQRAEVETAPEDWEPAMEGSASRRFAMTARHKTLVIDAAQPFMLRAGDVSPADGESGEWVLLWEEDVLAPGEIRSFRQEISALPTSTGTLAEAGYGGLMYADLWSPLAALSRWIERALAGLSALTWGPAVAIVLLAVGIRLVTLPVSFWSARRQREFVEIGKRMQPQIDHARAHYKGAEQSERILAIYKENGISPFSGLKGSVGLFVQIPFLLAVFNVTTASALFAGAGFLWISDLSLPDTAAMLPFGIPLLGNHLNALPIALGAVNVFSLRQPTAESGSGSRVTPLIVTLLIVFLFYSFAAAVVLYWLTVNLLQAGERILLRRIDGISREKADSHVHAA